MEIPFVGGCDCGAVRYECTAEPVMVFHCHCQDCRMFAGNSYSSGIFVPASALRVTKGEPKYHTSTAESGSTVSRGFCANCGSPVVAKNSVYPGFIIYATSLEVASRQVVEIGLRDLPVVGC